MIPAWTWELIVAGACVSAYAILRFVTDTFRPAIDRAGKPHQEEL